MSLIVRADPTSLEVTSCQSVEQLLELLPVLKEQDLDRLVDDLLETQRKELASGFLTEEECDFRTPREILEYSVLMNLVLNLR